MNVESFNRFRSFTYIKDSKFNDTYLKCHPSILRNNVILSFGVGRGEKKWLRGVEGRTTDFSTRIFESLAEKRERQIASENK